MKSLKLLVVAAVAIAFAGCDTTAFTEDFPDPGTDGLPPYVAFDMGVLETNNWVYNPEADEAGSARLVRVPPGTSAENHVLRVRLPVAIEEDVTVTYNVTGTAQYGTDFRLYVFDLASDAWVETPLNNGTGQLVIEYSVENPPPASVAPHYRDLRISPQPGGSESDLRLELVSASAPSGRELMIGRFPDSRDEVVSLGLRVQIAPQGGITFISCPDELEVGESGTFEATVNADASQPLSFAWEFGDGATASGQTVTHSYSESGTYTVDFTVTGPVNAVSRTCSVTVGDDD